MTKRKAYFFIAFLVVGGAVTLYALNNRTETSTQPKKASNIHKNLVANDPIKEDSGPSVDTQLQTTIQTWANGQNGSYGVSVKEINGKQRTADYQMDKTFVTASTYKLFITYAILHQIERGTHSLNTPTSIGMTVQQCIDAMLIHSNNDCGYPMGQLIGWANVTTFLQQQGFQSTNINNYDSSGNTTDADKVSTPEDEADFMQRLATGKLLNKEHTELMLSRMKQQVWRERIPAGIPTSIAVADKPGWLPGINNDTAVVYGPKSTYVLSIMSTGATSDQLAALSKIVYEYLNN